MIFYKMVFNQKTK